MRSKYRKASLNKPDEAITIALNNAASSSSSSATTSTSHMQISQYNDNNSVFNHNLPSSTRKSQAKISNPTNFQHLQHMGPNDGKLFMHDSNTLSSAQRSASHVLNASVSATLQNTSTSSSSSSNHNTSNSEKK